MEGAAARRVGRVRQVVGEPDPPPRVPQARVRQRHRGQQGLGVRVAWPGVQLAGLGHLDDLAEVHHRDPVADALHHRQVVGDEQVGQAQLLLQIVQQVEDLGPDRDVQRRDRLIGDHESRVEDQRPGDVDPLPLATGERVRVAPHVLRWQPDPAEHLRDPVLKLGTAGDAVRPERIADDLQQRHPGVEGRERVLEDDPDLSLVGAQLPGGEGGRSTTWPSGRR